MRAKGFRTGAVGAILVSALTTTAYAGPARDLVRLTNEFRSDNNLPELRLSPLLESIASTHGVDMRLNGFFSHTGTVGSSVADRARRQGYDYCLIAENIAMGQRPAKRVTRDWIKAFPFIYEAYPEALKKFQHSSGVKRSQISPMASMS